MKRSELVQFAVYFFVSLPKREKNIPLKSIFGEKHGGQKIYQLVKKYTQSSKLSEWVRKKKNIPPKKKYTALNQKEWVGGTAIFTRKTKIYDTFASVVYRLTVVDDMWRVDRLPKIQLKKIPKLSLL